MFKSFNLYFAPPGDVTALGSNFGTKGDLAILNDTTGDKVVDDIKDDDKLEVEEDTEDTKETDDEPDEEDTKEDDEDEDKGDEEEEEDKTEEDKEYSAVPAISDIKKKFPDFFKQFPEVRASIFRDQKFSEVFATPKEAANAADQANTFMEMETDLLQGDSDKLFGAIKKVSPEAYSKLVANLLPTLEKGDKELYLKVAAVPLKKAIRAAIAAGRRNKDTNLEYGAAHLHKFLFDSDDVNEKVEFEQDTPTKSKAETEYEKRLQQLDQRDHGNFKSSVDTEFLTKIKTQFEKDLDPSDTLSDKMKEWMFKDLLAEVDKQLASDTRYMRQVEQLWVMAKKSGYQSEFKAKILNVALARANQLIPAIRQKLKKEAGSKSKTTTNGHKKVFTEGNRERPKAKPESDKSKSDLDIIRGL